MSTAEDEIETAIHRFFRAMDAQDLDAMERLVAHDADMVHVGTDAGEIWQGWDVLRDATVDQFERLESYDADVYDLTVNVAASGDVAWYAHRLDARIVSDGDAQVWSGARFTGVFENRDGAWRMVQTHVSLPASVEG